MPDSVFHRQLDALLADRDTRAAVIAALAAITALSVPPTLVMPNRPPVQIQEEHRHGTPSSGRRPRTDSA